MSRRLIENIGREDVEFGEVDPTGSDQTADCRDLDPIRRLYRSGVARSTSRRTAAVVRVMRTTNPFAAARCSQLRRASTGDVGSRPLGSYAITLFGVAASWARDARLVQDLIPKDDPQFVRGL